MQCNLKEDGFRDYSSKNITLTSCFKVIFLFFLLPLSVIGNTGDFGSSIISSSLVGVTRNAPLVQWKECGTSNPLMKVRFLQGVQYFGDVDYWLGRSSFKAEDKVRVLTSLQ